MIDYVYDCFIYEVELPGHVNEMVVPCLDGYTIYIDSRLTPRKKREAVAHAVIHIHRGDFDKHDVDMIEAEAHHIKVS